MVIASLKRATIKVLDHIMPDRLKKSIFHLSFHLANSEFEKFAYLYSFAPNMKLGLGAMAGRGFRPRTIVDVGAFEGSWSRLAKRIWPECQLFMVEPNLAKQDALSKLAVKLNAQVIFELLGEEDHKVVEFNLMEEGSSIMSERSAVPRRTEQRILRTLDTLFKDICAPALLKIDAQGYELQILKGATRLLPRFQAILLEIAILEINEGAPLLHDVVAFMKSVGFVAYDIFEIHRRPLDRALNQIDIIFVREESELIGDKRHFA